MNDMTGIKGTTRIYGILGNPVAHSFSPLIHNTLAEAMGIDMAYVPLGVSDAGRIGDAVRGAAAMGFPGMNVTVPYKSAVIPFLAEIDPVAKAIGAVNTLVMESDGSGYKGYNTDYLGLRRALQEMGLELPSMDVVLIGAGGAARAAAFMCGDAGVPHLTILNRTVEKAEALAQAVSLEFPGTMVRALPIAEAVEAVRDGWNPDPVLAIQCTNVGLAPHMDAAPVDNPEFYQSISAAYDCIYNPEETRFLSLVKEAGKPGRNGMDMLLWQGICAFELWTGRKPERDLIEEVRGKLNRFIRG